MCFQTWTLGGEHSDMAVLRRRSIDSISSREQERGSARNSAPESAALATVSSADAIVTRGPIRRLPGAAADLRSAEVFDEAKSMGCVGAVGICCRIVRGVGATTYYAGSGDT